jgi:acetyltransferase-like isoleucine patch superfamily enzyme
MNEYSISELPKNIIVTGNFDATCKMEISAAALRAVEVGKLKIRVKKHGGSARISRIKIYVGTISGNISLSFSSDNQTVFLGDNTKGSYLIRLIRKSHVLIGKYTTSIGVKIYCDNSEFGCGEDCMFSSDILIQTSDQHGIVDLDSGNIINQGFNSVVIGDHVWLGRQSTLVSSATIGDGTIIGTGALVSGSIPAKVIAVGTPARVIRENHTWTRIPDKLDAYSLKFLAINKE